MNADVKHMQVTTATRFDPRGTPVKTVLYSYFLGSNGPFTEEFPEGQNTPEAVNAAIDARAEHLRAVGALPAATY